VAVGDPALDELAGELLSHHSRPSDGCRAWKGKAQPRPACQRPVAPADRRRASPHRHVRVPGAVPRAVVVVRRTAGPGSATSGEGFAQTWPVLSCDRSVARAARRCLCLPVPGPATARMQARCSRDRSGAGGCVPEDVYGLLSHGHGLSAGVAADGASPPAVCSRLMQSALSRIPVPVWVWVVTLSSSSGIQSVGSGVVALSLVAVTRDPSRSDCQLGSPFRR
jgi:hypothetical protein